MQHFNADYYIAVATVIPLFYLTIAVRDSTGSQVLFLLYTWYHEVSEMEVPRAKQRTKRALLRLFALFLLVSFGGEVMSLVVLWLGQDSIIERAIALGAVVIMLVVSMLAVLAAALAGFKSD